MKIRQFTLRCWSLAGFIALAATTQLMAQVQLTSLAVNGTNVASDVLTAINTSDNKTATIDGDTYTVLPTVTAAASDSSTPEVTASTTGSVATYAIKAGNQTFTLNINNVYAYTMTEKDETVNIKYTAAGKQSKGVWSNGLYTLESDSIYGFDGDRFVFRVNNFKFSVPGGVIVKQFSFSRYMAGSRVRETAGILSFTSEGATCHIPTDNAYVRGTTKTVTVTLENHQPGQPIEFSITTTGDPYAEFDLVVEKTNPQTTPKLISSKSNVTRNHANISLSFDREMTATEATIDGRTIKAEGAATLDFNVTGLEYNKTYTLTIAAGAARDIFGNANTEPFSYELKTSDRPVATKKKYDYVVSNVDEFVAAFAAVNASNKAADAERATILILDGDYNFGTNNEQRLRCNNVSLIGQSRNGVLLHGVRDGISNPIINIRDQSGFYLQDLTLQNDHDFGTNEGVIQAVAIYGGNKTIMKNVRMHGNQDTQVTGERSYFDKCEIHGMVDFICGGGNNFYDQCNLVIENRDGCVIAAPNTPANLKWGYVFSSCTINPAEGSTLAKDGSYFLGRPWQNEPRIYYLNTKMNIKCNDRGWNNMSNLYTHFYEYGSVDKDGNLIDLSVRQNSPTSLNTYVPTITAEEASKFTIYNVMESGTDGWLPTDYTQLTKAPVVTVSGKTLSWEADSQVRAYVIFKDGAYLENTTETSYTVAEDGTYTIRTANEMGGLSTDVTSVSVGATGIDALKAGIRQQADAIYNLSGQKVGEGYRGIVVSNGKKIVKR